VFISSPPVRYALDHGDVPVGWAQIPRAAPDPASSPGLFEEFLDGGIPLDLEGAVAGAVVAAQLDDALDAHGIRIPRQRNRTYHLMLQDPSG
jgi:hypothetical protein